VSTAVYAKHGSGCLDRWPVKADLRKVLKGMTRSEAWEWAVSTLLPKSPTFSTVFNLNHFRRPNGVDPDPPGFLADPQSNATVTTVDYAVLTGAFTIDLESHASSGNSTAPWDGDDVVITRRVLSRMDPLFDA
jgi:hypothetical protein